MNHLGWSRTPFSPKETVTTVNVARFLKVDPEDALCTLVARFSDRFRHVEQLAAQGGKSLTEMTIGELDALWETAKRKTG